MDRDQRWDRVATAYDLLVEGRAPFTAPTARAGLDAAYARGENDEFVKATVIPDRDGRPATMADGDVVVFMNFRADRARQITSALTDPKFQGFERSRVARFGYYCTLTSYGDEYPHIPAAFAPQSIANGLGEYLSNSASSCASPRQKYAHVVLLQRVEAVYPGEDRTGPIAQRGDYDLKPEMSAPEVTDKLVAS